MNVKVGTHTLTIEIENDINAGEYNITPVNFEFSEEYEGLTKMAVFTACGSEPVKEAILNNQCIIPLEVLEQPGVVSLGVYGYETDGTDLELRYSPKAQNFNVKVGSYREGNDPELPTPTEWERVLELINEAITETNNLNIDVNKEDNITTITLTKKDGTQKIVQVEDGKSLEFNWRGTELGVRVEGESQYEYVNLKGDKGDAGAIKMQIVDTLPQTGSEDTIYLVPLEEPETQENRYAEYVWINNQWELLGKIGIQVDLTDYYTKQETNTLLNGKQNTLTPGYYITITNDVIDVKDVVRTNGNDYIYGNKYFDNLPTTNSQKTPDSDNQLVPKKYVDSLVGDINTALDTINGEVI